MGRTFKIIALAASAATLTPSAASAQAAPDEAEMLRQLDIMLMVTSLRCRFGEHDFRAEYDRFATRHLPTMDAAARQLEARYRQEGGAQNAQRRMDRLSTGIANRFGQGHPWLECDALREVAGELADADGRHVLLAAAHDLLGAERTDGATLVARYGN